MERAAAGPPGGDPWGGRVGYIMWGDSGEAFACTLEQAAIHRQSTEHILAHVERLLQFTLFRKVEFADVLDILDYTIQAGFELMFSVRIHDDLTVEIVMEEHLLVLAIINGSRGRLKMGSLPITGRGFSLKGFGDSPEAIIGVSPEKRIGIFPNDLGWIGVYCIV